jgi:UDP-galactopyranose mutase
MTILIIGAGLSGCVLAERYASLGKKVVILEKRSHIAGNCYDYRDSNGILISKYGPHLFHTDSEVVWSYVQKFSKWIDWKHKCYAYHGGAYFPIPMNIKTVNDVYGLNLQTGEEMEEFLKSKRVHFDTIETSEQLGLNRFGKELYEKFIEGYTTKQWNRPPSELDSSVVARIPIRYSFEEAYFSNKYQALPEKGYTEFCMAIIANSLIDVKLSHEFEPIDTSKYEKVFYTGPIDAYFSTVGLPKLQYRSLRFEIEDHAVKFYQANSIVNYPDTAVPYTRITEYKHFLNQESERTTIVKEYPSDEGEPYYPIPDPRNRALYEQYRTLAEKEEKENNVFFVGRLANYKYFNMDDAILNALELFEKLEEPKNL